MSFYPYSQPFNDDEIAILTEYLHVLRPLALAIDKLQGQNEAYYGFLIPVLEQLNYQINQLDDLQFTSALATAVKSGLKKRFGDILKQDMVLAYDEIMATVTHPQFRLSLIKPERREKVEKELIAEAQVFCPSSPKEPASKKPKLDPYFSFSYDDLLASNSSAVTNADVKKEVRDFLEDKNLGTIDMLHKYPNVKK